MGIAYWAFPLPATPPGALVSIEADIARIPGELSRPSIPLWFYCSATAQVAGL